MSWRKERSLWAGEAKQGIVGLRAVAKPVFGGMGMVSVRSGIEILEVEKMNGT